MQRHPPEYRRVEHSHAQRIGNTWVWDEATGTRNDFIRSSIRVVDEAGADFYDHPKANVDLLFNDLRRQLSGEFQFRKLGEQLLRHVLTGGYAAYAPDRIKSSLDLLFNDLRRQLSGEFQFEQNAARSTALGASVSVPIVVIRRTTGRETWVTLNSPIAPDVPVQESLRRLGGWQAVPIVCVDDLLVRRHLPQAVQSVRNSLA
jgi:hypothetical protein